MGLKEIAIRAYENEMKQTGEENLRQAESFAVLATEILKERIGEGFSIQVISKDVSETVFDVDGIKFKVGECDVYVVKNCPKCGAEYQEDLMRGFGDREKVFRYIGKILVGSHNDYDCGRFLEEKEGKKEPTTDEKLLHALKDFMQENVGEYVG